MEFLYVRVTFLHTGVSIFAHPPVHFCTLVFLFLHTPYKFLHSLIKQKILIFIKNSNIINKNCIIIDENLKHV